jgi:hypothetical protein
VQLRRTSILAALSVLSLNWLTGIGTVASASSNALVHPFFSEAKILWESEAVVVSGALQNVPLAAAVADLQRGLGTKDAGVNGYASAISTIRNFESIPLTSETTAQIKAARRDWSRLNAFFEITPAQSAVFMDDVPSGAYYKAAQHDFVREPHRDDVGINVGLLKTAALDLVRESRLRPSRSVLYAAAIHDLTSLEGASSKDIASSGSSLLNPYGQDILYLNVFFETTRLAAWPGTDMLVPGK